MCRLAVGALLRASQHFLQQYTVLKPQIGRSSYRNAHPCLPALSPVILPLTVVGPGAVRPIGHVRCVRTGGCAACDFTSMTSRCDWLPRQLHHADTTQPSVN